MAYSEELNYFPAIYLNQAGREPFGIVQLEQVDGTIARIRKALLDWRDPQDGAPIIRQVFLREEVFQGSEIGYAPDLILDLNLPQGYSYALGRSTSAAGAKSWRNLLSEEYLGAKGNSMNGAHRRQGTFLVNRSGSDFAIPADFNLAQMAPMILNMLGMDVPAWMSKQPESKEVNAIEPALAPELSFTPTEEADLRKNLLDLGYLS